MASASALASALAITYITECAPAKYRGTLSSAYQLLTILGIFLTNVINFGIANAGSLDWGINSGWRWMLGIGCIPAAIFFLALFLGVLRHLHRGLLHLRRQGGP